MRHLTFAALCFAAAAGPVLRLVHGGTAMPGLAGHGPSLALMTFAIGAFIGARR